MKLIFKVCTNSKKRTQKDMPKKKKKKGKNPGLVAGFTEDRGIFYNFRPCLYTKPDLGY